jgi:2'-5' RNA ligase
MTRPDARAPHVSRVRAFVAVSLPPAVINRVIELGADLRARAREAGLKVAWVGPSQLHITLKFLGEIPEESAWAVRDRLGERLAGRAALALQVRGAGAFPAAARPRAIWIGVREAEGLVALAADVDAWLDELGFAKEQRQFHPHLTLGRVKAGAADILGGLEEVDFGRAVVNEVTLYRSVLRPQGPEYTPLGRFTLEGTAAAKAAPESAAASAAAADDGN